MPGQRRSKQDSWAIVKDYAAARPEAFGGAYVGGEGEAAIVTLWTDDPAPHREALTRETGRRVDARQVRWSFAYLEQLHGRVAEEMEQLVAEGIAVCLVGDNVMDNCVDIGVTGLTPAISQLLTERFGAGLNIFEEEIIAAT